MIDDFVYSILLLLFLFICGPIVLQNWINSVIEIINKKLNNTNKKESAQPSQSPYSDPIYPLKHQLPLNS
jgi:hypothetical protein